MKRMNNLKNVIAARIMGGLVIGMTAVAGVAPVTVFAQSQEAECICEEKCSQDSINEECAVCLYDYNVCQGVDAHVEGSEECTETAEESYGPLTPDGNMNLVDDYGSIKADGKQFITVTTNHESFIDVITAICFRIMNDGQGWVPFVTVSGEMFPNLDVSTLQEGDRLTLDQEVRLRMDTVAAEDGIEWLYIFTNEEESHKKPVPNVVMEIPFRQILETGLHNDKVAGVVINPFGKYFKADKKVIECIFDACRQNMEGEA